MKVRVQLVCLLFTIAMVLVMAACGGNATPATVATNPTPTTPTATPTPPPSPTPAPSPTPPPSLSTAGTGVFEALMISQTSGNKVSGTIVVDLTADDGRGTMQVIDAAANGSYSLQFCPFPSPFPSAQQNSCTTVSNFGADAGGKAAVNFQFPKNGIWSGIFVAVRNDVVEFASGFNVPGSSLQFRADLHQASSITSGTGGLNAGGDALKNGSVTVTDNTAHVELVNATISVTYGVTFCLNGGGSSCSQIGTLTTDETGSGKADIDLAKALGTAPSQAGIFRLTRSQPLPTGGDAGGVQFMTAFVSGCPQVRCE